MPDPITHPTVRVRIETVDAALAERWRGWLCAPEFQHGVGPPVDNSIDAVDVFLTDRAPQASINKPIKDDQAGAPFGGTVYVGGVVGVKADASLPTDCTARELALACRLVGVIARQRRHLARVAADRSRLSEAAMTDPLTGLPNRRAWDERVPELLEACRRGLSACLGVIDLDLFKAVNDRHGHAAGDRALQLAAASLRSNLRHSDFLARLGGDEFGVMLSDVSPAVAAVIAERARAAVHAALEQEGLAGVTASAGVVVYAADNQRRLDETRPQELFESADRGLLKAKRSGRNRMVVEVLA